MEATAAIVKQGARRKSKHGDLKKQPQRGMGVEMLERIRIGDEIRNKTSNSRRMTSDDDQINHTTNTNHHLILTSTFQDPSLQLHLAMLASYAASHTLKCYSPICFKKKRINGGNMVCNAERRMCAETNHSNIYKLSGFDAPRNLNHDLISNRQETEMVAVDRKGNEGGGKNNVMMEYEFFPGMKTEEKAEMMKNGSSVYDAAGYESNKQRLLSNSCIDLELKLSY